MGLKIEYTFDKDKPWEMFCYSDSDYAGDPGSHRSIYGYILYVKVVLFFWILKAQ